MKVDQLKRFIEPLQRRVFNIIARGVLRAVKDDKKMQLIQVSLLQGETKDDVERFQNYGFTSNPLPGAEVAAIFPGGNRDHGIVIAVDDRRFRLNSLVSGEVAMYTDEGDSIILKRGRNIEVVAGESVKVTTKVAEIIATTSVTLTTPLTTATGDLQVDGEIHADGEIKSDLEVVGTTAIRTLATGGLGKTLKNMIDVYNTHNHNEVDNAPNPTGAPNQLV